MSHRKIRQSAAFSPLDAMSCKRMYSLTAAIVIAIGMAQLFHHRSSSAPSHAKIPLTKHRETCRLFRVVDGDTIRVNCGGTSTTVRLLRINTPEMDEPGYAPAKQALKELLGHGTVQLESERPGALMTDRFGRRLAYVFKSDKNINVAMVRMGWSTYWTKYGQGRFRENFERAERQARQAKSGLWSE